MNVIHRNRLVLIAAVVGLLSGPGLSAQDPQPPADPPAQDTLTEPAAPVDADRAAADAQIQADLQAALDRIPELSDVEATVEAGVVRLDGRVVASDSRDEAEELARAFDGVLFVVNRIAETTSLGERLASAVTSKPSTSS